jgi:hypothetical protein
MIYQYNSFNIHDIGDVTVTLSREAEGGDAPQRTKVTLRMTVDVFERSYDDNYQLLEQLREALRTQQATLRWHNEAVEQDYVNQTAALMSHDLPEEWGEYHQRVNLVFVYYEQNLITQNTRLELRKNGGTVVLQLDNVTRWAEACSIERFDSKRSQRKESRLRIAVNGSVQGNPKLALPARRSALAAQAATFRAEMNGAEATLTFGVLFSGTVRVESFETEVDQVSNQIVFSFVVSQTLTPDEADYATVELGVELKDGMTGETFLNVSGKIQASSEVKANAKLALVQAALVASYIYGGGQLLSLDKMPNQINSATDGDAFTEMGFSFSYRTWRASNQGATFKGSATEGPSISFGQVRRWDERYSATRFNPMRSQRSRASGQIDASGTWKADMSLSLEDRRASLLVMKNTMLLEVNSADGTLTYGGWSHVVRISDLRAEVNQAETGIEWSFTAEYSLFPDEGGYATCEFSVDQRDDVESGDKFMTFAGKIMAPNGALARAKLATLRTTILTIYGWTTAQRLRTNSVASAVDANGDSSTGIPEGIEAAADNGTTLLELSFNEEYRARITGTLVSREWTTSATGDISTGLTMTTYAGSVTAAGATADLAYATALAAAQALGAGKEGTIGGSAFLRRSMLTESRRQSTADNDVEHVRLTFTYEYESKVASGNAYIEATAQVAQDTFGMDVENVSGFVVSNSFATAQSLYLSQVRNAYNGQLVRNESTAQSRSWAQSANATHELRIEFSFQVFKAKAASRIALRYSISVTRDLLNLSTSTSVRGSAFADTKAHAEACVDAFFEAMDLGSQVRTNRTEDNEYTATYDGTPTFSSALTGFVKLDFEDEYRGKIDGDSGVVEMQLNEEVRYSGTRWVVQPLPYDTWDEEEQTGTGGISIPQPCGVQEGLRTVRGSVTAASLPTATAWALRHRGLLTGDGDDGFYPLPEVLDVGYDFVPRVDGIAADDLAGPGSDANVQMHRVNFTFAEILPNYPALA